MSFEPKMALIFFNGAKIEFTSQLSFRENVEKKPDLCVGSITISIPCVETSFFQCEDAGKIVSPSAYLALPSKVIHLAPPDNSSGSSSVTLSHGFVRSSKESITVRTKLCSTKLTQNGRVKNTNTNNFIWKSFEAKIKYRAHACVGPENNMLILWFHFHFQPLYQLTWCRC